MTKTKILNELRELTKIDCQQTRSRSTELESKHWLDDDPPLTVDEKELLDARLRAYAKDPDAGSAWEEVEDRIRARLLVVGLTDEPRLIVSGEAEGMTGFPLHERRKSISQESTWNK